MSLFNTDAVQRYYDENTKLFLSLGEGSEGTIHRAIWAEGVTNHAQAMLYVESLVGHQLKGLSRKSTHNQLHVVDLGCGVCSSLCRLAADFDLKGTGITISEKQASWGTQRINAAGLTSQITCLQGDFCHLPPELEKADLAFGIESFVHAPCADDFFKQSAQLVRPDGHLILCDDFASKPPSMRSARAQHYLKRFQDGWFASSLLDFDSINALAAAHGFVEPKVIDLTPYLRLGRPRD